MYTDNREEYKQVSISELGLSARTFNALVRGNLSTLYLLIDSIDILPNLPGMGTKSIAEIEELLQRINRNNSPINNDGFSDDSGSQRYNGAKLIEKMKLSEEILSRPIADLNVPARVHNAFHRAGIDTIAQAVTLNSTDLPYIRNMGALSMKQFQEQIELLYETGENYFAEYSNDVILKQDFQGYKIRELDIATVKKLQNGYGLKTVWLCEWYNLSKQRIHQILQNNHNRGNWCGKQLSHEERLAVTDMINARTFYQEKEDIRYYLVNNMSDDCAFLTVSCEDIKCFFLADLPSALQARVKFENLHKYSENECAAINTLGRNVFIMKKKHFMPTDSHVYRKLASARGLSSEAYSYFLFGIPYCSPNTSITDERITAFLEENTIDGRTFIPSTPDNQWIRSYISRSPYNTDEFIALYGFEPKGSGVPSNLDFETETITIEKDMQVYECETDYIERIYAKSPLLGSILISPQNIDVLNRNSRKYIGQLLNNSHVKPNMQQEMQITLAVINYAKGWDTEDESGFWKYITTQFGYRDERGHLRNLLCNCVKDALIKNCRWFIANSNGNQYKSSIVVHAFSTKRSWFHLCDFLFDFYKTNLGWEYVEDDPMTARMVLALRNKMRDADDIVDEDIEINSQVYYFREGIRKLILYRPIYATQLLSSLIKRINDLVNHAAQAPTHYEEQLCDEWMANKLLGIAESRHRYFPGEKRAVAIDYTRIKPVYLLCNENEIRIAFPDVRLAQNDFTSLKLTVYQEESIVQQKALSFYGNELGKTMTGFTLDFEDYLRQSVSKIFNPQIVITCDQNEVYNSEKTLYRENLAFRNEKEININSCEQGGYSIFVPHGKDAEFVNADLSIIKENSYLRGYYVNLQKDFVINMDGELVAFDNAQASELRIVVPGSRYSADYIVNGARYCVLTGKETIRIISSSRHSEKKYRLAINSEVLDLDSLPNEESAGSRVYKLEIDKLGADEVILRIMDLAANRLTAFRNIKIIRSFSYHFNRPYYFSADDFKESRLSLVIGEDVVREYPVSAGDAYIRVPYQEGELEVSVPAIKVIDNINTEWNGANLYWINNIPQESFLYAKAPSGIDIEISLDNHALGTESTNAFALGNTIFSYSNTGETDWLKVYMSVSKNGQDKQRYFLGKIAVKEQFIEKPKLEVTGAMLSWDRGYGFIGDDTGNFKLTICEGTEYEHTYDLDLDCDVIAEDIQLPLGKYAYIIRKQSGNIFDMRLLKISSGSLFVGDVNELRFLRSTIRINTITFENEEKYEGLEIRPCCIDKIEYQGVQYVGSEDRICPVYTGTMFFLSNSGNRHEYSMKEKRDANGQLLYQINPVKIVYINDTTLSITNVDGEGLYYYRYYDKYAMKNFYQITDREPTKFNQDKYYLADLYSYTREEHR